ncbi:MAG: response regulator transcription factor [Calothrix sp. MO_167.B42]|nr:response regulator transcription factor [Calothrix sp. MO_167.B42]
MKQILIVEDEARLAAFVDKGLRKHGFETQIAEDGNLAINQVASSKVDLLLLDLGLPVKDGLTVLKELRSQGKTFPIIVVTARTDDKDRTVAMASGANDYMTKPFRFKELLERINAHLGAVKS